MKGAGTRLLRIFKVFISRKYPHRPMLGGAERFYYVKKLQEELRKEEIYSFIYLHCDGKMVIIVLFKKE